MTGLILRLVAGVALIASNAFFVASEFALTRIRQLPEAEFKNDPSLRRAWQMTSELEIYLTGCQVGITISSIRLHPGGGGHGPDRRGRSSFGGEVVG